MIQEEMKCTLFLNRNPFKIPEITLGMAVQKKWHWVWEFFYKLCLVNVLFSLSGLALHE